MDFLQQHWQWTLLAVGSGTFLIVDTIRAMGNKAALTPLEATLKSNREDAIFVDVREQNEYIQGHIPNSRHIPLSEFDRRSAELEKFKGAPIILCCATGSRSSGVVVKLQKAGFDNVFNLKGGLAEWEKSGQPLATGRKPKGKK